MRNVLGKYVIIWKWAGAWQRKANGVGVGEREGVGENDEREMLQRSIMDACDSHTNSPILFKIYQLWFLTSIHRVTSPRGKNGRKSKEEGVKMGNGWCLI